MNISVQLGQSTVEIEGRDPIDISIPLHFNQDQPNAFFLPRAESVIAEGGEFVGDTRRGGSCNCETVTLNPHGNGTHTECSGHLSQRRIAVADVLRDLLIPTRLVSVEIEEDEWGGYISFGKLKAAVSEVDTKNVDTSLLCGLAIRTLPNDQGKKQREWSGNNPPRLHPDAAQYIRDLGICHLLVDLPSLDRDDDPLLTSHRIFWDLPSNGEIEGDPKDERTITEMIYVPDEVADGLYLLNLQIPPFILDAAPSRPLLYRVL